MSEEWDDDDVWDDPEPIVEVRKIDVDITTISQKELLTIEEAMTVCLDRKLEKLNLLLKMMTVYQVGDCLLVNDRYNAVLDFIKTVEAFGMDIKQVNVAGLRGKTYLIGDVITKLLRIMGTSYNFSNILDVKELPATANMDGVQLFGYDALNQTYDSELTALLTEIKRQGRVRIQGTETLIDGVSQGIVSDQARISEKLKKYLVDIKKQACENNKNVQYGTTEILYTRARQMGYSVQKEVKGNQVQLVLVRVE
jgi:hypothetical protein